MKRMPYDDWENEFTSLFEENLDEEPLYPYEHLWRLNLTPREAFEKYLEENPDYAEKLSESTPEESAVLELAKKLELQKLQKEAEEKLGKFCPECARLIGNKNFCKCGYRRPKRK